MIYQCKPVRVEIFDNEAKLTAAQVKKETGCDVVFNGSFYDMDTRVPNCDVRDDGTWLNNDIWGYYGYGWRSGQLPEVMTTADAEATDNFISCVWCILDGERLEVNDKDEDFGGTRGRTAFGFSGDGTMYILCTSDGEGAMLLSEARDALWKANCISGIILDGGGSSQIDCPAGKIKSTRKVSNYICVWEDKELSPTPEPEPPSDTEDKEKETEENTNMKIIEPEYKWAYNPGNRKATTHLILHHAAWANCSAETIHRAHLGNGWAGIAYHYFVRHDGTVYRGRPVAWQGGHTKGMNHCSLGICFEGNFENEYMSEQQLEAGQELIADIRRLYPDIIVGKHCDFNATACPGKNFPFTFLVNPETGNPEDEGGVEDYGASDWAAEDAKWAIDAGLFFGDGAGNYNWQEPMTREAQAAVLHRFAAKYRLL
ncbi:MAG: N-acetylmuramoyl-L-alanine amidase [Oscillospiraceae bacterium]